MAPGKIHRWGLLVTVSAGLLLITLDNSILYTALPTLAEDLGATGSQSLWIINAYPVVMAGLLLGTGTLGDRVGHRRMFLLGLAGFGAISLIASFSATPAMLIGARAALAVAAAVMLPATLALIRVTFRDEHERNIAIAVWGTLSVVGSAFGPIVGGLLLEHFWWGSVFLINVPVAVVAFLATLVVAPANAPSPRQQWDLLSSVYAMLGLVGLVLAIKEIAHTPPAWSVVAGALAACVTGFTLFARRQQLLPQPLLDLGIFRNRVLVSGVVAAASAMFAISGAQLLTAQQLQLVEGFTPLHAGLLVSAVAVGSLPTTLIGGAVLNRTGLLPLITGGLAAATAGVSLSAAGVATGSPTLLVVGLLLIGVGVGTATSVASTAIVGSVPARRAGMASSVDGLSYEIGSLTAVALLGSLLTFVYSITIEPPPRTPDAARDSMSQALTEAAGNPDIIAAAKTAFDTGYLVSMIVLAFVLAIGTATTGWLLRRRLNQNESIDVHEMCETA